MEASINHPYSLPGEEQERWLQQPWRVQKSWDIRFCRNTRTFRSEKMSTSNFLASDLPWPKKAANRSQATP